MADEPRDEAYEEKGDIQGQLNQLESDEVGDEEDVFTGGAAGNTLEFVLRDQSMKSRAVGYMRATPWWVISVALHLAAILIFGKIIMSGPKMDLDDIIITTEIKDTEPEPLDLEKIEKVFKEMKELKIERVVHAPTLIESPTIEVEDTPTVNEDDLAPDFEEMEPDDTDFTGIDDGLEGDGYGLGEVDSGDVMGIGEGGGFNARGMSSYSKIMDDLSVRLSRGAKKKYRGNVLLIWLMDASISMKDDQVSIRERLWEMDKKFREQEGAGELMQAVVYYSDKPHMWLKPTSDVDEVMKAIEAIEVSPPGTIENTMQAVIFTAKTFGSQQRKGKKLKKVMVLVDDDSADDSHLTESALQELRKARMSVFVINRECPFQSTHFYERFEYVDEDGEKYTGSGYVRRGPETAFPEVANISWGQFFSNNWNNSGGGRIMSGFGIYDISRLAYYSGGAYYILDPMDSDEKMAMYDWELMELYRPELVSRNEYQKRTARNPFKHTIEKVAREWNAGAPRWHWVRWPEIRSQLKRTEKKLSIANKLISEIDKNARMPTSKLEKLKQNRRWPASADLVAASMCLARYRVRQFKYSIEKFIKETSSIPEDHIVNFRSNQKPKKTKEEARDRVAIIEAMRFVADRHPRTPWGKIAATFNPDSNQFLYGFELYHHYYFPPYWAIVTLMNGRKYEAYITDENKKKNTVSFTVPKKGSRTVSRKIIKSITRLTKPSRSHNPHPRI